MGRGSFQVEVGRGSFQVEVGRGSFIIFLEGILTWFASQIFSSFATAKRNILHSIINGTLSDPRTKIYRSAYHLRTPFIIVNAIAIVLGKYTMPC